MLILFRNNQGYSDALCVQHLSNMIVSQPTTAEIYWVKGAQGSLKIAGPFSTKEAAETRMIRLLEYGTQLTAGTNVHGAIQKMKELADEKDDFPEGNLDSQF